MLQFLESPVFITLIVMFFFLLFFILFLTMSPRTNGKRQVNTDTSRKVAKENLPECTMFGFLKKLPKGDPLPRECMGCRKLVECSMAKRAFDWYLGRARANGTETLKHI